MRWVTALSTKESSQDAVDDIVVQLRQEIPAPDLVLVFPSQHFAAIYGRLSTGIASAFEGAEIVGCAARGVLAGGTEVETGPALVAVAAELPNVEVTPLQFTQVTAFDTPEVWNERLKGAGEDDIVIVFADSFSCDIDSLLDGIDRTGAQVCGALSSAGMVPGQNAMIVGPEIVRTGAVGVLLKGDIKMEAIVAQGCRPIGQLHKITRVSGDHIWELDGQRPADLLNALYQQLPVGDRALIPGSLVVGVVEDRGATPGQTEFLIRHMNAIDPNSGTLSVDHRVEEGMLLQFHLRDGEAARNDMQAWLAEYKPGHEAALLFSCIGRGERLLGEPNHDSQTFLEAAGGIPLAGFFGAGEIGPFAGRTHMHAYTSMFALFSSK